MSHDPIAYTYEAAHHCEGCARARFGTDARGDIVGTDSEGNEVGVVAPWDEWHEPSLHEPQTLACDTCGEVIEEHEPEGYVYPLDESDARRVASEWHGGQSAPLYAFASSGTVLSGALGEARECEREASPELGHSARDRAEITRLVEYLEEHPPQEETLL